jgi:hypothetical protein
VTLRDDDGRETGHLTKVRWLSRTEALRLGMQHHGLLTERLRLEVPGSLAVIINGRNLTVAGEIIEVDAATPALPPATDSSR